jgi:hypothetical protein
MFPLHIGQVAANLSYVRVLTASEGSEVCGVKGALPVQVQRRYAYSDGQQRRKNCHSIIRGFYRPCKQLRNVLLDVLPRERLAEC